MTIADVVREASEDHPVSFSSDECLKCNVCNTVCPVLRVTDLFPGPKYEGPQAQRFRLAGGEVVQGPQSTNPASPDHSVDYCSGCGWCTTSCPAGVKIAEMNNQARARLREGKRPKLRDWGLGQTDLLGTWGVRFSPLANFTLQNRLIRAAHRGHRRDPPQGAGPEVLQAHVPVDVEAAAQGGQGGGSGRPPRPPSPAPTRPSSTSTAAR